MEMVSSKRNGREPFAGIQAFENAIFLCHDFGIRWLRLAQYT